MLYAVSLEFYIWRKSDYCNKKIKPIAYSLKLTAYSQRRMTKTEIQNKVIEKLKTIYDPEIPVDIYELGLVYMIDVNEENFVTITMTLTSPSCPVAETLPPEVEEKVASVENVTGAKVEITWEPTWDKSMMSQEAMLELGFL